VAHMIEILARGKWLPRLRRYEAAMPTEIPLDTIDDALAYVADAARCWEVNPSIYNDRRLTHLVEQAQDAIARTCPTTETTLRLLQHITPKGLKLAIIRCEDSGAPLIAISVDAALARSGRIRRPTRCCCWVPIWLRPEDRAVYDQPLTYLAADRTN
jgi:hypothetical protein